MIARLNREFPDFGDDGAVHAVEYMQYDFVQCRGCKEVGLRRTWSATFADEESVDYFPPPVSRARPKWLSGTGLFAFGGPKQLGPVLDALGTSADEVLFVGDTEHDRRCACAVGCRFAVATWNPRANAEDGDIVLRTPADVLPLLA